LFLPTSVWRPLASTLLAVRVRKRQGVPRSLRRLARYVCAVLRRTQHSLSAIVKSMRDAPSALGGRKLVSVIEVPDYRCCLIGAKELGEIA
jgi:hypothetical protein